MFQKVLWATIAIFCFSHASFADQFDGTWNGEYSCGVLHAAEIKIESTGDQINGTFRFYAPPSNPAAPEGIFAFSGVATTGTSSFTVQPTAWIKQPPNYGFAGFTGTKFAGDQNMMEIKFLINCSRFRVTKEGASTENSAAFLAPPDPEQQLIDACFEPDMNDPIAIYDCLALRGNGATLNSLRPTDKCAKVHSHLRFMMREAYKAKGILAVPQGLIHDVSDEPVSMPPCDVAAQVLFDVAGEEPYWVACLDYDPANKLDHFGQCLGVYVKGSQRLDSDGVRNFLKTQGCDQMKNLYYNFAMPMAYKPIAWSDGQIRNLPANIEDIDCLEIATIKF